jgi:hypothetical protein
MKENKLIAEFMGYELVGNTYSKNNGMHWFIEPQYHESWDWLMPVVEKIECTTIDNDDNSDNFFNVMIEVFECNINGGDICICKSGNTKLEATYKAVVEFINQYNEENESKD